MKNKTINVETCEFVRASDLFEGIGDKPKHGFQGETLWDQFIQSEPGFSWGDNNHSLVDAESIVNHLGDDATEKWVKELRKRIDTLPEKGQTYVDLEN